MGLWRKLFPHYDCRPCKDTGTLPAYRAGNYFVTARPCTHCERGAARQREIERYFDDARNIPQGLPPVPPKRITVEYRRPRRNQPGET